MKKTFSFFGLVIGFIVGYFLLARIHQTPQSLATNPPSTKGAVIQAISDAPIEKTIGTPVRLAIPTINVNADIESVGMDAEGRMDVPRKDENVAWYNLGYKPGSMGSAVIDGHFDQASGAPAVFYDISKLHEGDEVKVTDDQGVEYIFEVKSVTNYAFDSLPLQKIFNTPGTIALNLITCEGTWDKESHNYSDRTVVHTELKNI